MKSLFVTDDHKEILNRLSALNDQLKPQWGKMTVSQMMVHCQLPLAIALKKRDLQEKPNFIKKFFLSFFKSSLYNDSPVRKNLPTLKEFTITDTHDFEKEKERLSGLINEFHLEKSKKEWDPHPLFGKFTVEQWGKMQYKHLDHHLKQFNV